MDLRESEINLLRSSNLYVPIWSARSEQTKRVLTTLISSRSQKSYYQRFFRVSKDEKRFTNVSSTYIADFYANLLQTCFIRQILQRTLCSINLIHFCILRAFPHLSIFTRIQRNLCLISYKIKKNFLQK